MVTSPTVSSSVIPQTVEDICIAFALRASTSRDMQLICGMSDFNPETFSYSSLSDDQRATFVRESKEFQSIQRFLHGRRSEFLGQLRAPGRPYEEIGGKSK